MDPLLKVWAPNAAGVELITGATRLRMQADEDGYWSTPRPAPGTRYQFSVDGGSGLKDPRSRRQPEGIFGPSEVVDPAAFAWSDAGFRPRPLSEALIYELHVGTFTPQGTFDAVGERLDHLLALGVTHLQLMPVATFSGVRGWGYDGVDLYAPHAAYGEPDALKRLVNTCHARGLGVLLDVVYNHLGPEGNVLGQFGPYFTDRYHTPWGPAVNLDGAGSDQVRRYFLDNARMWLDDYHFDGLRLDAVHAFLDTSAKHILEELAEEVEALAQERARRLVLIAESDLNDPRVVRSRAEGGFGMHAQWSDDLHHALHAALTEERAGYYADFGRLEHVARALENAFVYAGQHSEFRNRRHGRGPGDLSGHHFLGYLQTHDQVGNRALGDRISTQLSAGRLKIGAALVMFAPFVPMLFMGEEWAAQSPFQYFTSHESEALAEAVRNGRRGEFAAFGWQPEQVPDPQALETFERSRLNWSELTDAAHSEVLAWYCALAELRRTQPELLDGRRDRVQTAWNEEAGWLRCQRGSLILACHIGTATCDVKLAANCELLLASNAAVRVHGGVASLPPDSVVIAKAG